MTQISDPATTTTAGDAPTTKPGIYRGWYVAGVSAISIGAVLGSVQFAFGFFIEPLEAEFGWSRTQINVALSIGIVSGFISPLVGALLDRFGSRWTMAVSLALVAAAFLLRSVMTELWQFYLFSVIIFAGTPGSTMMPASKLVMTWFPSVRGRMMGRVTAGNNLGSGAAAPIIVALIALVGWRWTYGIIGIALLGLMMFVIVIIRDSADDVEKEKGKRWTPGEIGSQDQLSPSGGMLASEAMRTSAFWFLIVGMTLQQFVRTGVVSQLFPHLQQVGFTTIAATIAMTLLAFGGMSSKLIFGWLSESITARLAFVLVMILQGIGMTALLVSGGSVIAWVAILIFGLGMGGVGALTPLVFTEMFGLKQFGRIMGLSRMAIVLPVLMGPILTGLIYDSTGSYDLMFGITIGLLVVSIGAFLLSRAPGESATSSGSNS